MKLKFTPSARVQFLRALEYIRLDDPRAAKRFRVRCERILRRLERFPHSGRHLPEFPQLQHREVIVSPYRFFYKVVGKTVWVVAIWHGARLPRHPD